MSHEQIYKINVKQHFTIMNKSEEQSIRQSMRERGGYELPGLHEFSVKRKEFLARVNVGIALTQDLQRKLNQWGERMASREHS